MRVRLVALFGISSKVFWWQATVCLCNTDGCNGASVPPNETDDDTDVVEIEELNTDVIANLKNVTQYYWQTNIASQTTFLIPSLYSLHVLYSLFYLL